MKNHQIKQQKTHMLRLSKFELLHLRDLFSIMLPPDASTTLSAALADSENRVFIESMLWKKISTACIEAEIPMGDEAPDFIIAPTSAPPLGVFQVSSDPPIARNLLTQEEHNEEEG